MRCANKLRSKRSHLQNLALAGKVGMVSRGRYTVIGLITGKFYSFRVSAVGKVGEGRLRPRLRSA